MMLLARIFLGFSAVVWLLYGLYCLAQPSYPVEAAGLAILETTGRIEVRAMYGGLQIAIGAFALSALLRPHWIKPALLMFAFLATGLAVTRLTGVVLDAELSGYTIGALCFEVPSSLISILCYARLPAGN